MKKLILSICLLSGLGVMAQSNSSISIQKSPVDHGTYRNKLIETGQDGKRYVRCEGPGSIECCEGVLDGMPATTAWHETIVNQLSAYVDDQISLGVFSGNYTESFFNPNDGVTYIFLVSWHMPDSQTSVADISWSGVPVSGN